MQTNSDICIVVFNMYLGLTLSIFIQYFYVNHTERMCLNGFVLIELLNKHIHTNIERLISH